MCPEYLRSCFGSGLKRRTATYCNFYYTLCEGQSEVWANVQIQKGTLKLRIMFYYFVPTYRQVRTLHLTKRQNVFFFVRRTHVYPMKK